MVSSANSRLCLVVMVLFQMIGLARPDSYYVDSKQGNDSHPGISQAEPWKTLQKVNDQTFRPGDAILFKRGGRWQGMLSPKGSGEAGEPIRIGAYGTGALPVIDGAGNEAALRLFNQQYWEIGHIETTGGDPYGIHISGDQGILRHFHIRDVVVHDVTGTAKTKNAGLIAIVMGGPNQTFEDVLIDGATAYRTTQWSGINVSGDSPNHATLRATSVTVRNCIVHDVYGDGIVLFQVRNGLLERNVTWNTGMQHSEKIGTPNAIWTWRCDNCLVQFNEGFFADSPGVDGGVYDIDWGNNNNTVQYNYAHDSQGYCVAVFGAGSFDTTNSVVRYNVCVNNGRSPRLAERQGDIFLSTWDGGALDGVKVYNNTVYWNPPTDAPALRVDAELKGNAVLANNLILSMVPTLISVKQPLKLENNLYWYSGHGKPVWDYAGKVFNSFDSYRETTSQDRKGVFANPSLFWPKSPGAGLLNPVFSLEAGSPALDAGLDVGEMGGRDVLGRPAPQGKGIDIGALEFHQDNDRPAGNKQLRVAPDFKLSSAQGETNTLASSAGQWRLISFLQPGREASSADSRSQVVFLQSLLYQYRAKGLFVFAIVPKFSEPKRDGLLNLAYDWNLGGIHLLEDEGNGTAARYGVTARPTTFLVDGDGRIAARWTGFAPAVELGLTLRALLGPPPGAAPIGME